MSESSLTSASADSSASNMSDLRENVSRMKKVLPRYNEHHLRESEDEMKDVHIEILRLARERDDRLLHIERTLLELRDLVSEKRRNKESTWTRIMKTGLVYCMYAGCYVLSTLVWELVEHWVDETCGRSKSNNSLPTARRPHHVQ